MISITHLVPYSGDAKFITGNGTTTGWAIHGGALPLGLVMSTAGLITGTPNTLGQASVTIGPNATTTYVVQFDVGPASPPPPITGSDDAKAVARYLGRGSDQTVVALADEHLPIVKAFVRAYVRGAGFAADGSPAENLRAVILSACARLTTNPAQVKRWQSIDYSETPVTLAGFTLPELAILHLYRRRAL